MIPELDKRPFSNSLPGERVTLVKAHPSFAEEIFDSVVRDREFRDVSWTWAESADDLRDYLSELNTEVPTSEVIYAIFVQEKIIGTFHVHSLNYAHYKLEVGFAIEKNFEGFGFVSESYRLIENELRQLGFNRVEIRCNVNNEKSKNLAERNQFQLEGILKQDQIEFGQWRDTALYAKLLNY